MKRHMSMGIFKHWVVGVMIALFCLSYVWVWTSSAAETPRYGGTLIYTIAGECPSYDGHQERTTGMLNAVCHQYSLLVKVDPENYPNIAGDVAESWTVSADNKTYTFKIRKGVKFHDGSTMTAKDVKASWDHIIFPPQGVVIPLKAFYTDVDKVEAPDDYTVVFRLKKPAAYFLVSLASPYGFIYKADILSKDPHWYRTHVMGTGPFKFVEHVPGSHWIAKRNEDYFVKGRPYLDGYRGLYIKDPGARLAAIRGGRADAEFRYVSPQQRDEMVGAMGNKIQVQENVRNACGMFFINTEKKPFNDVRVRRALNLALDRWGGAQALSKISDIKWVGGLIRPGSEFGATESELTKFAGFSKDIEASRTEARRLLREAGVPEGFRFKLHTQAVPEFQTTVIWAIDQWRQVGLNVEQNLYQSAAYYASLRKGDFEVSFMNQDAFMDDPQFMLGYLVSPGEGVLANSRYKDPLMEDLFLKQGRAMNPVERRKICREFEKRMMDEMAYTFSTFWNTRIVLHSSKVKGYTVFPSHQLQDFTNVWLSE